MLPVLMLWGSTARRDAAVATANRAATAAGMTDAVCVPMHAEGNAARGGCRRITPAMLAHTRNMGKGDRHRDKRY